MSFQDHLKTCSYCRKNKESQSRKPTVRIKSASSNNKQKKLTELGAIIRGTLYPSLESIPTFQTKGGSSQQERQIKLKELGRMIRGY